jgi:HEAT repeat protein
MGSEKALEALIALYDSLQDPRLQRAVITSIGFTGEPTESAITKFREIATTSSDPGLQQSAIRALAHTQSDRGVDVLISIYDGSGQTDLKKSIIRALSQCRSSRAVEKLKEIAKSDGDASLRLEAVRSLSHLGSTRSFAFPMPVEVALPAPPAPPLLPEQEEPPTPPQE